MPKAGKSSAAVYAVALGYAPGLYSSWNDAEQQVKGFKGAAYKKFKTRDEAQSWMNLVQSGQDPTIAAAKVTNVKSPRPKASSSETAGTSQVTSKSFGRQVFCDGACPGNGKPGAVAGAGIFWNDSKRDIAERVPGRLQTNQRAELYAILRVLESDDKAAEPLEILTDSAYSISCLSEWHHKWAANGWKTATDKPVVNAELIKRILYLIRRRPASGRLKFTHVRGHQGVWGNEEADQLAVAGSKLPNLPERDYEGETEEDELWAQVGDLPLGTDMLEFDIGAQETASAEQDL